METGHVEAYVIWVIRAHTNLHLCRRPLGRHPTQLAWKTRRLRVRTRHCSQITHIHTHKTTRIVPGGSHSSIWSLMSSGSGVFFNQSSECIYLRSLKDDQAKQDVVRAKQKQRWGVSMQLKPTSCKSEGTRYRHSILWRRWRGRKKKDRKEGER